jgi:hypothetical protein
VAYCRKCGFLNQDDAAFCERCGTSSAKTTGQQAGASIQVPASGSDAVHPGPGAVAPAHPLQKHLIAAIVTAVGGLFVLIGTSSQRWIVDSDEDVKGGVGLFSVKVQEKKGGEMVYRGHMKSISEINKGEKRLKDADKEVPSLMKHAKRFFYGSIAFHFINLLICGLLVLGGVQGFRAYLARNLTYDPHPMFRLSLVSAIVGVVMFIVWMILKSQLEGEGMWDNLELGSGVYLWWFGVAAAFASCWLHKWAGRPAQFAGL